MPCILTVDSLAHMIADQKLAHYLPPTTEAENRQNIDLIQSRKRIVYNFSIAGFNITTILSIAAIAMAVLVHSPLAFLFAVLAYQARRSFMKEIDGTGLSPNQQGRSFVHMHPSVQRDHIATYLHIEDPDWTPIWAQFLDFRVLMRMVPSIVEKEMYEPAPVGKPHPVILSNT